MCKNSIAINASKLLFIYTRIVSTKFIPFTHAPVVGSQETPGGQCSQPVVTTGSRSVKEINAHKTALKFSTKLSFWSLSR